MVMDNRQRRAMFAKLNNPSRSNVNPVIIIEKDNILNKFNIVKSKGLAPSQRIIIATRNKRKTAETLGKTIAKKSKLKFFKK